MTLTWRGVSARLGRTEVLHDVSVEVPEGALFAVVGPNGAGKSTLLRTAAALVRPSGGIVMHDGVDLVRLSRRERALRVGHVPQTPHLDHPFSVREVVAMGRYAHLGPFRGPVATDVAAVDAALAATRLAPHADRPVTRLSGGERQRVLLARALAQDPAVLLLDEPVANLDLGQAHRVLGLMRDRASAGKTVIVVLHDLELASRVADHVALLSAGRVLSTGPPAEVLTAENVSAAFGVPVAMVRYDEGLRVRVTDTS
ncbi:MAG: ABC transporter ATP-binding protein [Euryarchaeota archaeon]|nr:ABC transporter ATP-binding protein [Euryarchaeota archaeon]